MITVAPADVGTEVSLDPAVDLTVANVFNAEESALKQDDKGNH